MRVILDTNLWSSIGDEGVAAAFDDMMRARAFRVVVPPSILLEVVRTPAPEARQRIIAALYHGRHIRPPSEAESECMEMVAAVRKHRRQWMRTMADTEKVRLLNNFWTNKVWRSTLEDSQPLHESQIANMSMHEQVLRAQRQQRKYILEDRPNIRPLTALMATALPDAPESWLAGWSGQDVEPWRIENREVYWHELGQRPGLALLSRMIDTTYADWVGAFVDLSKLRRDFADFTRFWLEDAERDAFPRNWVRWAVNLVQSDLKITRGNPSDGQHSSYLVDCDLFLSADMNYISALQIVYEDAPFGLAEPRLVSGDRSVSVLDRVAASL